MYTWYIALAHLSLAILLFFIVNWIGEHSKPLDMGYVEISLSMQEETAPMFNYLFKVLAPVVYIVLLAVLFQVTNLALFSCKIFWIVIDYWVVRFLFLMIRGRLPLLNWKVQIIYWISSIGLAIWVNSIIDSVSSVLPSPEALIEQLWLVIILFLYSILNKIVYPRDRTERRINNFILNKYCFFNSRFGGIIDSQFDDDLYKALVYSIMIHEDYNRPKSARFLERVLYRKSKKRHTYGIMQYSSDHVLTDTESLNLAIAKIHDDIKVVESEQTDLCYSSYLVYMISCRYNPGDPTYGEAVQNIFAVLQKAFFPDIEEVKEFAMPDNPTRDSVLNGS